jgi:ADP-ribose pyrophosphatase
METVMPDPSNKVLQQETILKSRIFDVVRKTERRDGKELVRDIVIHPGAVAIIPVLPDGRIVLIENWRTAFDEHLLEIPAGTREPNEEPEKTAIRELAEETGYRAGTIRQLTMFYTSPGILREEMYVFLATDLTEGETNLDEGEEIQTRIVDFKDAVSMVRSGEIKDGKTVAAILLYAMEQLEQR